MKTRPLALLWWLSLSAQAFAQTQPAPGAAAVPATPPATSVNIAPPSATLQGAPSATTPTAAPAAPSGRVLSLAAALEQAKKLQPLMRQAYANTDVSRARVGQARAPLLPQVTGTAAYQLTTNNIAQLPGVNANLAGAGTTGAAMATAVPAATGGTSRSPSFDLYNSFNFVLSASQLVYDFGVNWKRKQAAETLVEARKDDERSTELQVAQNVRVAFFNARAAKALVNVAHDTYDNTERHLQQIEGFVRAGTRAEIDLAQARTDRANAQVGIINAENGYASAKATLNQAMGVESSADYDVSDDGLPEIEGEDGGLDGLVQRALNARPEFLSLARQVRAQELTIGSIKGGYWPTLGVSTAFSDRGRYIDNLAWNWNAGATLSWQIFQGGLTNAQVDEARATLVGLYAQVDILRQQTRLDVEQAQLAVRAGKAVLVASAEVVRNARERMRLADGRYATGVGNIIELADAQLALTQALAQQVQAEYNLAAARAGLLHALGLR